MLRDGSQLTIGEVATRSGVPASTLRYYERVGVLPPPYRVSGQRRYGEDVLGRLSFVGVAQQAGFTLREIRELLSRVDGEAALGEPMRALSARKLPEVEELLERATRMRAWLATASECTCATTDECALFDTDGAEPLRVVQVPAGGCRRAAG